MLLNWYYCIDIIVLISTLYDIVLRICTVYFLVICCICVIIISIFNSCCIFTSFVLLGPFKRPIDGKIPPLYRPSGGALSNNGKITSPVLAITVPIGAVSINPTALTTDMATEGGKKQQRDAAAVAFSNIRLSSSGCVRLFYTRF